MITRTGANRGDCAIYDRDETAVASSHTFIVRPNKVDPFALAAFFNSAYGKAQIDRGVYGAAQPEIAPYYLKNIFVPNMGVHLEKQIRSAFDLSDIQKSNGEIIQQRAENVLLASLGLDKWHPATPLTYSTWASVALDVERLDAEFFAPRITQLINRLGSAGLTIKDVAPPRHEKFNKLLPGSFDYIEIGDISGDGTAGSTNLQRSKAPSRATWHVHSGDVITSTVRPIRRLSALIEDDQEGSVCSSGFVVLQPSDVRPEVLLTYLRLPIFCELMDLHTSASMYPAISEKHLLNLPFAPPDPAAEAAICDAVTSARSARRRAAELLEAAKRAVEIAIEQDETAALRFLDEVES